MQRGHKLLRQAIKSATNKHFWTRYATLACWRSAYAAYAVVSNRNRSGRYAWSEPEMQAYSERVFSDYKQWVGIEKFRGVVAEVGPGSVSAVARLFLADGVSRVDQVERFNRAKATSQPGIRRFTDSAESFFSCRRSEYDFIVSCAVLEHLYDPLLAVRGMAAALKPGGMMIHAIDCRDHGQFSGALHDLSFLRIPKTLYKPIGLGSGLNRIRLSSYLQLLHGLGMKARVLVLSLSGVNERIPATPFEALPAELLTRSAANLSAIRDRLAEPFRSMDDRDLLVSGFALVAHW